MTRALAKALALNRIAFGLGLMAVPERVGRGWVGARASRRGATQLMMRALGARDLALGVGGLVALRADSTIGRGSMLAHAFSDGADLAFTIAARDELPRTGFLLAAGMAGASTAIGIWSALALREPGEG